MTDLGFILPIIVISFGILLADKPDKELKCKNEKIEKEVKNVKCI